MIFFAKKRQFCTSNCTSPFHRFDPIIIENCPHIVSCPRTLDNNYLIFQLVVIFLSVPSSLFYLLPASLQMLSASLVATLASWLGETAENVTNECRERTEQVAGELVRKKNSRRRRRS